MVFRMGAKIMAGSNSIKREKTLNGSLPIYVQAVKHPVHRWGKDDTDIGYKDHPAKKRIQGGKPFARIGFYFYHGTHTAQNHRGIMQGVKPGNIRRVMITEYTYKEADEKDKRGQQDILQYPLVKHPHRG